MYYASCYERCESACKIARKNFDWNIRLNLQEELENYFVGYEGEECPWLEKPEQKQGKTPEENPFLSSAGLWQDDGKVLPFVSLLLYSSSISRANELTVIAYVERYHVSPEPLKPGMRLQYGGVDLISTVFSLPQIRGHRTQDAPNWSKTDFLATPFIFLLIHTLINSK